MSYGQKLEQIRQRVECTMCAAFSSDGGDIGEIGHISRHDFDTLILAALSAPKAEAEEPCPVCAKPFAAGDTCATDIELGKCHAECLAGSPTVDLETGEPVDGPIGTFPHVAPKGEALFLPCEDGEVNGNEIEARPISDIVPDRCTSTSLAFSECVLCVKKDGSGYIAVDEQHWELEDDRSEGPDGPEGSIHWITRFPSGELEVLRDFLNGVPIDTAPVPALTDEAVERATHRHKKRGSEYVLIGIGKMQAESWFDAPLTLTGNASVDMREVAIYRGVEDGSLWVSPLENFEDGRFEALAAFPSKGEGE